MQSLIIFIVILKNSDRTLAFQQPNLRNKIIIMIFTVRASETSDLHVATSKLLKNIIFYKIIILSVPRSIPTLWVITD